MASFLLFVSSLGEQQEQLPIAVLNRPKKPILGNAKLFWPYIIQSTIIMNRVEGSPEEKFRRIVIQMKVIKKLEDLVALKNYLLSTYDKSSYNTTAKTNNYLIYSHILELMQAFSNSDEFDIPTIADVDPDNFITINVLRDKSTYCNKKVVIDVAEVIKDNEDGGESINTNDLRGVLLVNNSCNARSNDAITTEGIEDSDDLSTTSAGLHVDVDSEYIIGKNDVANLNSPTSLYIEDLKKNNEVLRDLLKRLESRSKRDQSDLDLGKLLQATENEIAYLNDPYESEVSIHSDDHGDYNVPSDEVDDIIESLSSTASLTTHPFEIPPVQVKSLDGESYKKYINKASSVNTAVANSDGQPQPKLSATQQRLALEKQRAKDRKKKDLLIKADKLMADIEKESGLDPSIYAKFNTEKRSLFKHRKKETDDDDDDEIHRENLAKDCIKSMRLKLSGGDEEALKKRMSKSEQNLLRSPFGDPITRKIMVNLGFPAEEDTSKAKKTRNVSPGARKHK